MARPPPRSTLFPCTTLFRSEGGAERHRLIRVDALAGRLAEEPGDLLVDEGRAALAAHQDHLVEVLGGEPLRLEHLVADLQGPRSEEHTSELQSQSNLVCRLL